ncbi:NB-ARC domain-containing protein [Actinoallomurus sp. NBC_01490]|uniref:AfsR/SARP family transcriptional regulator n=1 Tax=Actinoallomurus sp. NBC_01490 TaxID=2903557 RepID=UPI002E36A5F3|nr:BTAD domain-containing putative transcriptional regulator [Actinoallomurus sp. NBC_01490]
MKYGVLGALTVTGSEPLVLRPRERSIVALLVINRNHVLSTSRIVDELWSSQPPESANNLVQQYVSRIRGQLRDRGDDAAAESLRTCGPGYLLSCDDADLDSARFESMLDDARDALAKRRHEAAVRLLSDGLHMWRGAPFLDVQGMPTVAAEACRLEEQRLRAIEERLDAELALGRHTGLVSELTALVAIHPFRERLRGRLMLALYRSGRQAEALEQYRGTRRMMMSELGVEPGYELRRLQEAILNSAPNLNAPESVVARWPVPAQLPSCIGDFTGRSREVAHGCEVLRGDRRPGRRRSLPVLKLVGKPGVGKTTLAVRIAHQVRRDFPDGQLFIDLEGLGPRPLEPSYVLERFLRTLGVPAADLPGDVEERRECFLSLTADRHLLLVLDNCADEAQIRPLLPGSAGCAVIITGRQSLAGLEGARHLVVEPLGPEEAVELLSRVSGHEPAVSETRTAAEVVRLCRYVPLAIRIAGSMLAVSPAATLDGVAGRLRTAPLDELAIGDLSMRSSIRLSYERLDSRAQRAFRRLALLQTSHFADWICAAVTGEDITYAGRLLDHLAQHHLLESVRVPGGHVRYFFDGILRAFALERAHVEEPADVRHAVGAIGARPVTWSGPSDRAPAHVLNPVL